MSVSTDEPTVKTDIASLECGNSRKFGTDEVGFYKSVLLVKNTEYVKLDLILALAVKRGRAAGKKIEKSLKRNYYLHGREWPYKNVKPRIIAERYLEDMETGELRDYKWYCFQGIPRLMAIFCGRSKGATTADYFDTSFQPIMLNWGYKNAAVSPKKPENFEKMRQFAELLSKDMPFLRVDFYELNGKLYLGELTFFDGSGFDLIEPEEWDKKMGAWIDLPQKS